MTEGRVRIPGFSSRSSRRWLIATAVAVVAVMGYLWVAQPENRVFMLLLIPLALYFTALVWQSTWLDPVVGSLVRVRCRVWRREVRLEPGTTVSLAPNGGGALLLKAKAARGPALYASVVARTDYVERSQPPALLRQLADVLEQHRAGGARPVAEALRKQADHLEAGGTVASSPLAGLITTGMLTAAKAGGAGAIGGHLG